MITLQVARAPQAIDATIISRMTFLFRLSLPLVLVLPSLLSLRHRSSSSGQLLPRLLLRQLLLLLLLRRPASAPAPPPRRSRPHRSRFRFRFQTTGKTPRCGAPPSPFTPDHPTLLWYPDIDCDRLPSPAARCLPQRATCKRRRPRLPPQMMMLLNHVPRLVRPFASACVQASSRLRSRLWPMSLPNLAPKPPHLTPHCARKFVSSVTPSSRRCSLSPLFHHLSPVPHTPRSHHGGEGLRHLQPGPFSKLPPICMRLR